MMMKKKRYMTPHITVEMFSIEATILEGSNIGAGQNQGGSNYGDNDDRAQAPERPGNNSRRQYGTYGSGNSSWGSLW